MYDGKNLSSSEGLISKLLTFFPTLERGEDRVAKATMFVVKGHSVEFGSNLRELRKAKGYNQIDLAKLLEVGQNTYSNWETGTHVPKLANIKRIVELLDADPADLMPVNTEGRGGIAKVPIITSSFLKLLRPGDLRRTMALAGELPYIRVPEGEVYDFAFREEDTDMVGDKMAIPPGSIALCQTRCFRDCVTSEQRFQAANGHLAVVSFMGMQGMIREVHFLDEVLNLVPWNPDAKLMAFPTDMKYADRVQPREAMKYLGYDTLAQHVEIFGVIEKSVQIFN